MFFLCVFVANKVRVIAKIWKSHVSMRKECWTPRAKIIPKTQSVELKLRSQAGGNHENNNINKLPVVVAFFSKSWWRNYGKNIIETNERRREWERGTRFEVCVYNKIIQLFFRFLREINYPFSKREAFLERRWLNIYKFMSRLAFPDANPDGFFVAMAR